MARTSPAFACLLPVVAALAFAAPATAAPLVADGTYVGQDRVAVTDGNRRARKADLIDRTITLDLRRARISGVANKAALASGDIVSLRTSAKKVRLPLKPARVTVKRSRPPKPEEPAPPVQEPTPLPEPLPQPPVDEPSPSPG